MNATPLSRMLLAAAISLALITPAPASAQNSGRGQDKQHDTKGKHDAKADKDERDAKDKKNGKGKPEAAVPAAHQMVEHRGVHPAKPIAQPSRDRVEHQREIAARQVAQQQAVADKQAAQRQRQAEHQTAVHQRVADKQAMQRNRLSERQQRDNILKQQQNVTTYRQYMDRKQSDFSRLSQQLQEQNRSNQYSYQSQYYRRLADQQADYRKASFNYDNDPYFYTAPNYRYDRDGRSYETNQYGADLLRNAVNTGYQEGYYSGQADRRDNWKFSFRDSHVYQDANYGYNGYYVRQEDYNHYFREGFQRGYDDGYYSRSSYGQRSNGSFNMLDAVLSTVLGLQNMR